MYNYIVYGLKIKSDIEIKEFIKSENENNDIDIVLGQAPDDIKSMISNGSRSSYSKTKVVLCQYFGHKKSNFFMLHF